MEATPESFAAVAAAAAAKVDFGQPGARKSGRWADKPYVPIIKADRGISQTQQVMGLAYATRAEAVAAAERHIAAERKALADRLAQPQYRALREHHGLPRELPA